MNNSQTNDFVVVDNGHVLFFKDFDRKYYTVS